MTFKKWKIWNIIQRLRKSSSVNLLINKNFDSDSAVNLFLFKVIMLAACEKSLSDGTDVPIIMRYFWAKILNLGNRNSFFQYFSGSTHSSTTASSIYWSYSMVTTGERFAFSWRSSGPRNLWRLLNSPLIADGAVGAVIGRCCSCKPRSSSFIIRSASSIFFEQENKSRL